MNVTPVSASAVYRVNRTMDGVKGLGRAIFAAVLLLVGGVLNIIYGIAAIGNSSFFVHNTHYVFANLKTWGWITLLLGILEIIAGLSLFAGGSFGRWFGYRCRGAGGDRRITVHPGLSVLVAGDLCAEPVDHPRPRDLRRARRHRQLSRCGASAADVTAAPPAVC